MKLDMRLTIAAAVCTALRETFPALPGENIELTETTSGCPMVKFTVAGIPYHLTVTRSRHDTRRTDV